MKQQLFLFSKEPTKPTQESVAKNDFCCKNVVNKTDYRSMCYNKYFFSLSLENFMFK